MIAVFENWWKQYQIKVWDKINIDKINKKEWEEIEIKKVLLVFDEKDYKKVEIWTPFVDIKIKAKIIENWKLDKIRVFKMKPKKRCSSNYWHKQDFTKIEILSIW